MDKERRDNLRKIIAECRKLIENEVARRLRYYGIEADDDAPGEYPNNLNEEDRKIRRRLDQAIEREALGGLDRKEAVGRYIRQVGFTYTNRLAALRAMEVRDLVRQTILREDKYGGRSPREKDISDLDPSMLPDEVLRTSLLEAFNEAGKEIKVLFDTEDEYSLVFPGTKTLQELLRLLSVEVTAEDWKEDDVTGWIYQYYNDDARKEYRASRRKPTPDDIPVINQFYTPHWLVKTLVDNTLGRLWVTTHHQSKLKEFCTYILMAENVKPNNEPKRARNLKIIDPACGSGHFLIYAFDVLYRIYREDEPETPESEIPALILEHNLHGIDIDLRAVQLAALSLYLKAKSYAPKLKVERLNLVCADIRIANGEKRQEFLKRFGDDPSLVSIFQRLFANLGYTYEIGSLFKIRAPFEQFFRSRDSNLLGSQAHFVLGGQTEFEGDSLAGQSKFVQDRAARDETSPLVTVVPRQRTIEEMLDQLKIFEREAFAAHDMGRLLFATDVEKSVGLLGLLSQKYDVVLMNPPYGDMTPRIKSYLIEHYPHTHSDLYAAFLEQAIELTGDQGSVGALTSKTFMFLSSFKWLRNELLLKTASPELILDLGMNVLEGAKAWWAASVVQRLPKGTTGENEMATFVKFGLFDDEDRKKGTWEEFILTNKGRLDGTVSFAISLGDLQKVPNGAYAYWAPSSLIELFGKYPPLDRDVAKKPSQGKIADVKMGLGTGDDGQFVRFFWEVESENITTRRQETSEKIWVPFYTSGSWLEPFYSDVSLVVNWANDGQELKQFSGAYCRNDRFYFRGGLTWMRSPQFPARMIAINVHRLPSGCIFSDNHCGLFPKNEAAWAMLGLLNSSLLYYLVRMQSARTLEAGSLANLPVPSGLEGQELGKRIGRLAKEAHDLLKYQGRSNEISTQFSLPHILRMLSSKVERPYYSHPLTTSFDDVELYLPIRKISPGEMTLTELAIESTNYAKTVEKRVNQIMTEINLCTYDLYGMDQDSRSRTSKFIQESISWAKPPQERRAEELVREEVERLLAYYVRMVLDSDEDGIVPFDTLFKDSLIGSMRERIGGDFGDERRDDIEAQIERIIGMPLSSWLEAHYFDYHVVAYKNRPQFIQITSQAFGKNHRPVFSCLVNFRKLSRNTVPKIQAHYLKSIAEKLRTERDAVSRRLASLELPKKGARSDAREEYQEVLAKIEELERFTSALSTVHNEREDKTKLTKSSKWVDRAIGEVRDNGWTPKLEYGVRVNIEPLKEAQLLRSSADRVK